MRRVCAGWTKGRDHHGRTRPVRFLRKLRASLSRRRRDPEGIEPAGRQRAVLPRDFAIDARTNCEAVSISPKNKTVDLRNVTTGEVTTESYDKLVLSPGASSVHPPLPGIDLPGIFHVRTVPDAGPSANGWKRGTTFLTECSTTPEFRC